MADFYYSARTLDNKVLSGKYATKDVESLREYLKLAKLSLISVYEAPPKSIWDWSTISDRNLLLFTRYFSTLIRAGISAYKAINILERQEKNKALKEKLGVISNDIKNGSTLFEAFSRFENLFGKVYLGLLRTGEETGRLAELVDKCAELIENKIQIRRKIVSIISYPIIIFFLIALLVFVIFMQIVPKFATLYNQMGLTLEDLPGITKVVISIADFIRTNLLYEIGGIIFLIALFIQFYSNTKGKYIIDSMLLKMPLIRDVIIKYFMSRFSRNLSVLFESGFSVVVSFERSDEIVTNLAVKKSLKKVLKNLENGNTISDSFAKVELIPDMTREMISIGEQTASFDKMLNNIADFYEKDLDYATETFINWVEPSIIIIMGVIVGTILLSVYLPVFSLASKMKISV